MKKAAELEYWVIDEEGNLTDAKTTAEKFDFTVTEFLEPVLEIKTSPYEKVEDVRKDAMEKLRKVVEELEKQGKKIVPLGTPVYTDGAKIVKDERFHMLKKFNPEDVEIEKKLGRAGTHFHYDQKDNKKLLSLITALEPSSALLNSSPYFQGEPVASSARNYKYIYDFQHRFPGHVHLWPYPKSEQSWKRKEEKRYQELMRSAEKEGIPEKKFREHYSREDALWTPVRLREKFNTVEWRSPDATLPSETFNLMEEHARIIERARDQELEIGQDPGLKEDKTVIPDFEKLKDLSRKAASEGVHDEVKEYLKKMGFKTGRFSPLSEKLEKKPVGREEAKKIRLETAEMLKNDIRDYEE